MRDVAVVVHNDDSNSGADCDGYADIAVAAADDYSNAVSTGGDDNDKGHAVEDDNDHAAVDVDDDHAAVGDDNSDDYDDVDGSNGVEDDVNDDDDHVIDDDDDHVTDDDDDDHAAVVNNDADDDAFTDGDRTDADTNDDGDAAADDDGYTAADDVGDTVADDVDADDEDDDGDVVASCRACKRCRLTKDRKCQRHFGGRCRSRQAAYLCLYQLPCLLVLITPFFLLYFMRPDHKKTPIGLIQAGTRARCLAKTGSREDCHWMDSRWYMSQFLCVPPYSPLLNTL